MKLCLHQFLRPTVYIKLEGVGDCRICKYNPIENRKCKRYRPVSVIIIEVVSPRRMILNGDSV